MANKKSSRKNSPKAPTNKASKKKASKKKVVARKAASHSSPTRSNPAKKGKVVKRSSSSQAKGRSVRKKEAVSTNPGRNKASVSQPTAAKKTSPVSQKRKAPGKATKIVARTSIETSPSAGSPKLKREVEWLSPAERYNAGGLFACAIDRASDPDGTRLRAVLGHLDLSPQDIDNLLRLSQGVTIPKLFAEGMDEHKVNQMLTNAIRFALAEGAYEKIWREDIRRVGTWLGLFPTQFEHMEQKVLARR